MLNSPDNSHVSAALWAAHPARWLAAIVQSSDDAIVGKTLDGVIRSWNAGAQRIFGYAPNEIIGRSVLTLIPPELHPQEDEIVSHLVRNERVEHFDTVRVRKDGTHVEVSLSVSPICDAAAHVLGAAKIARDITEANRLRRMEHEMAMQLQDQAAELEQQIEEARALQDELEQSNEELHRALIAAREAREDAERASGVKSQFLATMSHELRTPLNAIGGYVDLLDLGLRGPLTGDQRSDLERIRVNQRTLLRLIEDVLDFAKLESGRLRFNIDVIPVDDLLLTLETFITPMLRKQKIEYRFEPCGSDALARADRGKVEQIMLNLLSNALKFTDSGRIVVRCRTMESVLAIDVSDTGRGIPDEMHEAIFEPFVQAEQHFTRTARGTGLGLSISRELARGMGGDVLVLSQPGKGSTFTLILPRA